VTSRRGSRLCRGVFGAALSGALALSGLVLADPPAASGAPSLPGCPTAALAKVPGVVPITFWASFGRGDLEVLQALVSAFNSSQSKVHVTLFAQPDPDATWTAYTAGMGTGQLPAVAVLADEQTQAAVDTQSFLPAQSCIDATHYPTSDYVTRALDAWRVDGEQWGMPFAVSDPVLYYNRLAFQKVGIDPDDPPATLTELLSDAAVLRAHGSAMGYQLDPSDIETWLATADQPVVNNENGRSGRATRGAFDTPTALQVFSALDQLVRSGDATTNSATGAGEDDNLLGIADGTFAMTIGSSADLGMVTDLLSDGPDPGVQLGVAPFPAVDPTGRGGVPAVGSGLWISRRVPAAQQAAAWEFVTFLDGAVSQAGWCAGTGDIPVRRSATRAVSIRQLWSTDPGDTVAYDELVEGANTPASAGAVIGPSDDVGSDLLTAELDMFEQDTAPSLALAGAESTVNLAISSYNRGLGVR
jgi:sn-glycerol 3-phosphate transport system substrate-binding protein